MVYLLAGGHVALEGTETQIPELVERARARLLGELLNHTPGEGIDLV
jgi:hypothetical protein